MTHGSTCAFLGSKKVKTMFFFDCMIVFQENQLEPMDGRKGLTSGWKFSFWLFACPSLSVCCLRFLCWISVRTSCKTFAAFASVILRRLRFSLACVCCVARFTCMHMLHFCVPLCAWCCFLQSEKCVSKRRVLQTEHVQFPWRWQAVHTRALFRVRCHSLLLKSFSWRWFPQRSQAFVSLHVKHTR